ncbi:hypothetical protein CRG98_017614 [Punica granatum]|uniref:Uncharacterized protein n=1 Tax=Punica granatum TaxID=22663 RepID=A0A2I0K0C8_PUNGR|nr:hypothetical protein CRG98_017614 [Punica granatum]
MHAELRAIKEERDRLRCELVDSRAEVADYKELQTELTRARARVAHLDREMARLSAQLDRAIITGVAPLSDSSTSQNGGRRSSRHLRGSQPAGSSPFSTTSNARSTASDSCRHAPGVLGRPSYASPAPDVFKSAPCTGLTDALRLRRPSPHRGTRGHGQPNGHQHGRAACPTQGIQLSLFELYASTRTGADGRSNPPISAAAGPHGRPSSTGDFPILGARLVRASARFHTGPSYGLHSTSTDGFPGVQRTCSDSSSSRGASSLSVSTASRRPLLPGTAPHKHHLPRTEHVNSCGPVRLTDAFLPRGRCRTGA